MRHARRLAREAALQILYLCEVGGLPPRVAADLYFRDHRPRAAPAVAEFAGRLVDGTVAAIPQVDALIERHLAHWRPGRLAVIDRLILRMAAWELMHASDTPAAVVINEAIELARRFSAPEAVRFVNGVLDAVHRSVVAGEPERDGGRP